MRHRAGARQTCCENEPDWEVKAATLHRGWVTSRFHDGSLTCWFHNRVGTTSMATQARLPLCPWRNTPSNTLNIMRKATSMITACTDWFGELQLRNASVRCSCKAFFYLVINGEGSRSQWVVPTLDRWSWVL